MTLEQTIRKWVAANPYTSALVGSSTFAIVIETILK